ncbi:MAG: serine/threonine protein kinase [Myxococcaceae bacterium]|nr:serine/threonine protein kinase [Myxococcaceae bacterium]
MLFQHRFPANFGHDGARMNAPTLPSILGYRVLERLGSGATSDVLLAEDVVSRRGVHEKVIVKVLSIQFGEDDAVLIPFKREVESYGKVSLHSALVELKRAIVTEDNLVVLVLEYVEGVSLETLLAGLPPRERLPDGVVLHLMERIFAGLATAHAHAPNPVVHGEMRASNVLLGWDGSVKLADFGVTKILYEDGAPRTVLRSPFSYVAPEEVRGEVPTPASDVYAASLLIWELFSGFPPAHRTAETQQEITELLTHPNHPLLDDLRPDLPRAVRQLVATGLAADPNDRKLSAAEIVEVLTKHLPLERGKEKLAEILATGRPAHVVVPDKPVDAPAAAPSDDASVGADGRASAFGMLGGERGAPARREPRAHRAPLARSDSDPGDAGAAAPDSSPASAPAAATAKKPPAEAAATAGAPPYLRTSSRPPTVAVAAPAPPASWAKRLSIAVVAVCVLVVIFTKLSRDKEEERAAAASNPVAIAPPPAVSLARPLPTEPTAPSSSGSDPASSPASDMGDLRAGATALEHRIFVDGKVVGEGPGVYRVKCGKRLIRVGSGDEEKELDVPCGGELPIAPSPRRVSDEAGEPAEPADD